MNSKPRWRRSSLFSVNSVPSVAIVSIMAGRLILSHEDVAFLVVLRDVEAADFFFGRDANSDEHVNDLQNDERGNDA